MTEQRKKPDVKPVPGDPSSAYVESTNVQNLVQLLLAQIALFGLTIVRREGQSQTYKDFERVLGAASAVADELRAMDRAVKELLAPELDTSKATHTEGGKA